MEKIGIFGGSFDPVHNAHVYIGKLALETLALSRMLYVPTACPPHKARALTAPEDRVNMLKLALEGNEKLEISDIELSNTTYSYTADTLRRLKKQFPDAAFSLVVGADSAAYLTSWHDADYIFKNAEIVIALRGDFDADVDHIAESLKKQYGASVKLLSSKALAISSADIRDKVCRGEPISDYVPAPVEAYIYKRGLYRERQIASAEEFDIEKAKKRLSYMLKPSRYAHSIGTMETAAELARIHHYDVKKAQIAGLLHDCAKNIDKQQVLPLCDKYGVTLDEVTQNAPGLIHQFLGPAHAAAEFYIEDTEILEAIGCHTTGKTGMRVLDKILYLADFTEPGRDKSPFDGLDKLRRLCERDLDAAMLFALDLSIRHVLKQGGMLHPYTIQARNELLAKKK